MATSERPLANVDVSFVSSESVKVYDDTTFKEIYSSILSNPENVALVPLDEGTPSSDQGQQAGAPVGQPKHTVNAHAFTGAPSLIVMDRMMICTPIAPYWEIFPTRFLLEQAGMAAAPATGGSTIYETHTCNGGLSGIYPKSPDSKPVFENTWYALDKGCASLLSQASTWIIKEVGAGNFSSINAQIISSFQLKQNQPFAIRFGIDDYSQPSKMFLEKQFKDNKINFDSLDALKDVTGTYGTVAEAKANANRVSPARPTDARDIQTLADHYGLAVEDDAGLQAALAKDNAKSSTPPKKSDALLGRTAMSSNYIEPAIDVKWGAYILTFYKSGQIRLLVGGKQVGDFKMLPPVGTSTKAEFFRVIYPLGDSLFIYEGDAETHSTLTSKFVRFSLNAPINIPASNVIVAMRCGCCAFAFSPVVHPCSGQMISPPLGTGVAPDKTLVNVHYLGKFGAGNRSPAGTTGRITLPDRNDRNKQYAYLQGCTIDWDLKSVGTGQYVHSIKLNPNIVPALGTDNTAFLISAINSIYSPAVYLTQITLKHDLDTINYGNTALDACDVMQVSVNQAVEANSASITLKNRDDDRNCNAFRSGKYTHHEGQDSYAGVRPIKIDMHYTGGETYRVFTGYTTHWKPNRTAPSQSTISIECEDRTKKLKEQYAINLPFFDGHCHLSAVYYLCKQAGFDDEEILLQQDPRTGAKTTLRSLIQGDPETFTGGCFDGHMNTTLPNQSAGYASAFLHMRLPMALMMAKESPNYAFQTGSTLWQCISSIRDFSGWYLYANNWGNIIYGPPKSVVKETGITFKEVDNCDSFYEFVRGLSVDFNTTDTRNMVYMQGLTWIGPRIGEEGWEKGQWVPHVHIARKEGWPNDTKDHSHAPWRRIMFMRDSKWEDVRLLRLAASEMLRRSTRVRAVEQFASWGHPDLFPYDIVTLDESQRDETGINGSQVVLGAHTLSIGVEDLMLNSNFSCETMDTKAVDYDPNLPTHKRD